MTYQANPFPFKLVFNGTSSHCLIKVATVMSLLISCPSFFLTEPFAYFTRFTVMVRLTSTQCLIKVAAVMSLLILLQLSPHIAASNDESGEQEIRRRGLGKLGKQFQLIDWLIINEVDENV